MKEGITCDALFFTSMCRVLFCVKICYATCFGQKKGGKVLQKKCLP